MGDSIHKTHFQVPEMPWKIEQMQIKYKGIYPPYAEIRKHPCPNCGRKGLHYSNHPHASGYKEYSRLECRFCNKRFATWKFLAFIKYEI